MRPYRSILFLPGHKPEWVAKALAVRPDAIVLDLEDAVPAELKVGARAVVAESIGHAREISSQVGIFVRPNPLPSGMAGDDLEATAVPGLDGYFVPKVTGALDIVRWDTLAAHFAGRSGSPLEFIVPVEMAAAIVHADEIAAAAPRVGAMIGPTAEHADIARAVGYEWTPEGTETLYLRSRVLLAARAAGIHPLTGLWERVRDLDGLSEFAHHGRGLGFRGQVVIHPSHVPVVNRAYSPSRADVDFYTGLVAAYAEAEASGSGAVVYRNRHVDKAHVDRAQDWLKHAEAVATLAGGDCVRD